MGQGSSKSVGVTEDQVRQRIAEFNLRIQKANTLLELVEPLNDMQKVSEKIRESSLSNVVKKKLRLEVSDALHIAGIRRAVIIMCQDRKQAVSDLVDSVESSVAKFNETRRKPPLFGSFFCCCRKQEKEKTPLLDHSKSPTGRS